jgi:hypothetical protein
MALSSLKTRTRTNENVDPPRLSGTKFPDPSGNLIGGT